MQIQQELGLPQHFLVTDCATRWGSLQKMVSRVLEQQEAIHKVLSDDWKTSHLVPTWQDIDVLQSIQAALGPLADFTDKLSAENFVIVSCILPILHILQEQVLVEAENNTQLMKNIKEHICTYLEEKYSPLDTSELLNVLCFLDSQFITEYISTRLDVAKVKDRLAREGVELESTSEATSSSSIPSVSSNDRDEKQQSNCEHPCKKRKLGSWLKASKQQENAVNPVTCSPESMVQDEIEQYLKVVKPDPESNPLDWWKVNFSTYPILGKLAIVYLCIQLCFRETI